MAASLVALGLLGGSLPVSAQSPSTSKASPSPSSAPAAKKAVADPSPVGGLLGKWFGKKSSSAIQIRSAKQQSTLPKSVAQPVKPASLQVQDASKKVSPAISAAPQPAARQEKVSSKPAGQLVNPVVLQASEPDQKPSSAPVAPAVTEGHVDGLPNVIQQTALQQPPVGQRGAPEEMQEYQIQLEPPGPERLFGRLESEAALHERMRQEARQRPTADRIVFPEEPVLSKEPFAGRHFPPMCEIVEPSFVCYCRLLFEEKNSERYGWDLGVIQPFVSAGVFYFDVLALPYHLGTDVCHQTECNAGYCLPGDPVPYLLYPPKLSVTGALAQAGVTLGLFAVIP